MNKQNEDKNLNNYISNYQQSKLQKKNYHKVGVKLID